MFRAPCRKRNLPSYLELRRFAVARLIIHIRIITMTESEGQQRAAIVAEARTVDRHAVSQLRRHQGRRRRLRHAAGPCLRRYRARARRSIRGRIRSIGICIVTMNAISASFSIAPARSRNRSPATSWCCATAAAIRMAASSPMRSRSTIVHAFHPARMVLEEEIERNASIDAARAPRFFSFWAKKP